MKLAAKMEGNLGISDYSITMMENIIRPSSNLKCDGTGKDMRQSSQNKKQQSLF